MTVKPSSLPRWANSGGSILVPPSGTLDVGHLANQAPFHSYENWYKNLVYQWIVQLNTLLTASGGASDPIDTTGLVKAGSLNVTGVSTTTGLLTASGGISTVAITASGPIAANGGVAATTITASGSASVTGVFQANGGATATTITASGLITANGGATAGGLITANAGISVPTGQSITLVGTATEKHGTRTLPIGFTSFVSGTGSPTTVYNNGSGLATQTGGSGNWLCCVLLPVGKRILTIRVFVKDSATGPTVMSVNVLRLVMSTGVSTTIPMTGTATSSGSGSYQTIPLSVTTPSAIVAGNSYLVQVVTTSGTALVGVGGVDVDYDEP